MIILALLRHAEAVKTHGDGDHARPLSGAGRDAAAAAGRRLAELLPHGFMVVASDARRTRQTAELAFPTAGADEVRLEPFLYAAPASDLLATIRDLPAAYPAVVLVGHNPGISELASMLAGEGAPDDLARVAEGLAPADAVILSFPTGWGAVSPKAGRVAAVLAHAGPET